VFTDELAINVPTKTILYISDLLHRLPDVKNILFSFVGPELNVGAETEANDGWAGIPNCADCQGRARSARYRCFRMKYEEFKATDYFQEPDLVFAQNCGFSEFSDEERFRCYHQYTYPQKNFGIFSSA